MKDITNMQHKRTTHNYKYTTHSNMLASLVKPRRNSKMNAQSLRHSSNAVITSETPCQELQQFPCKKTSSQQLYHVDPRAAQPHTRTYTISDQVIGRGAKSVVKLGRCDQTLEKVAVKIVDKRTLNPTNIAALQLEEEVLKKVESCSMGSNRFVRLLGKEETASELRLYMEYIGGGELFDYCVKHPRGVPEPQLRSIMRQILTSVEMIHGFDIVHLDLKLENLMYNPASGHCTILDFGFAKHDTEQDPVSGREQKVAHRTFCGSIHYAAPELICQTPFDGKKADVWSLGVLLFAMAGSRFPFDDPQDRRNVIFNKILRQDVKMPSTISRELASLIRVMLTRDPALRPSVSALLNHPWFHMRQGEQSPPKMRG
mmetsp:Transcript_133163/g.188147  ORF Transcript_133163/g.188147 Transcript_133163/m.188147 type:complete len:372 (-) Transcript_133163:106-1221(-)